MNDLEETVNQEYSTSNEVNEEPRKIETIGFYLAVFSGMGVYLNLPNILRTSIYFMDLY